ncbi:hypothetical protein AMAG_18197 [Allomyces macrogynus ATCC 38327]|uniref:Uncharacterized protein n=1 Tax=Allomyces macrogynus (strain ATCC 38327) TaxID=578462 RepID=A0A0L0SAE5_ALLM3|nr:hypothetical protein AMAG_18197 [Allomyces macrogynus ATCC 38327]|eukprot:KNE59533.1 hypothetical protein AMAG_18197 [Allomyces macrogynus ATCC 38327]
MPTNLPSTRHGSQRTRLRAARAAAAGMVVAPGTPVRPVVTPPSPPLTPDLPKPAASDLVPVTRVDDATILPPAAAAAPADGVASL